MTRPRVAVVGGGPAGLSAACAVVAAGAATTVIDEQPRLGGRLRYRRAPVAVGGRDLIDPGELVQTMIGAASDAGVSLLPDVTAWALFAGNRLALSGSGAPAELEVDRVILATGSTDRPYPFPGGSLPGVFSARAVHLLLNHYHVRPGRRFVILGDGPDAREAAGDVNAAGGEVAAVVGIAAPGGALAAEGETHVERVVIDGETVEADTVVVAVSRQPDADLARLVGAGISWRDMSNGHIVVHDAGGATTVPGVFVTGDAAGVTDIATALARGQATGLAVAASLSLIDASDPRLAASLGAGSIWSEAGGIAVDVPSAGLSHGHTDGQDPWDAAPMSGATEFVCRCEEVSAAVIRDAIDAGAQSINDVKRRTRAGMGACQGCFCTGPIATLLSRHAQVPRSAIDPMTARPPVRLLPLERLAGRGSPRDGL